MSNENLNRNYNISFSKWLIIVGERNKTLILVESNNKVVWKWLFESVSQGVAYLCIVGGGGYVWWRQGWLWWLMMIPETKIALSFTQILMNSHMNMVSCTMYRLYHVSTYMYVILLSSCLWALHNNFTMQNFFLHIKTSLNEHVSDFLLFMYFLRLQSVQCTTLSPHIALAWEIELPRPLRRSNHSKQEGGNIRVQVPTLIRIHEHSIFSCFN